MELHLSSDQELLRDTSVKFLDDTCPLTTVREWADRSDGFDRSWWRKGAELGWTSMLAPESLGGGGVSDEPLRDLAQMAFARGRVVAPGPFVPCNVAVAVLGKAGERYAETVGALMGGEMVAAIALDELGQRWGVGDIKTSARRDGDHVLLDGVKAPVEAAGQADVLLVLATLDGDPVLVLVPADTEGLTVKPRISPDLVRRFGAVHLDSVRVPATAVVATGTRDTAAVFDLAAVLQLAETVGALDRVFEFSLEWTFDRYSFGRPLASYQEIKHRFADMKLWLESAKATTIAALAAVGAGADDAPELVSSAKAYVNAVAPELVQDCVQMHGGIGVTWDHDIHLYLRRVTVNSATYGTATDHRLRLAALDMAGA